MQALKELLHDSTVPNSTVCVRIEENNVSRGVSEEQFQAIHARLAENAQASSTKWEQHVWYEAVGSDGLPQSVFLKYKEQDPASVQCVRVKHVGETLCMTGQTGLYACLFRRVSADAASPKRLSRYSQMGIQMRRQFTLVSSSVKSVQWKFTLTVEWSSSCLKNTYCATPVYYVNVELDTRKLLSQITDSGFVHWLAESLKVKVESLLQVPLGAVCSTGELDASRSTTFYALEAGSECIEEEQDDDDHSLEEDFAAEEEEDEEDLKLHF
jgi:hypothetical protein